MQSRGWPLTRCTTAMRGVTVRLVWMGVDGGGALTEHANAFRHVGKCELLGRGDDDSGVNLHGLADGELDIPGAGGEVQHEVVEVPPPRRREQLIH